MHPVKCPLNLLSGHKATPRNGPGPARKHGLVAWQMTLVFGPQGHGLKQPGNVALWPDNMNVPCTSIHFIPRCIQSSVPCICTVGPQGHTQKWPRAGQQMWPCGPADDPCCRAARPHSEVTRAAPQMWLDSISWMTVVSRVMGPQCVPIKYMVVGDGVIP